MSHLSDKGESEVLAHSRTQWTVLNVIEGQDWTEISVVEAENYMEKKTNNSATALTANDSMEQETGKDAYLSLAERMRQQSKLFGVNKEYTGKLVPPIIIHSNLSLAERMRQHELHVSESDEGFMESRTADTVIRG